MGVGYRVPADATDYHLIVTDNRLEVFPRYGALFVRSTGIIGRGRRRVLADVPRVPGNLRGSGRTVRRTPPSTPSRPARPAAGHFVRDHIDDTRQSATPAGGTGAPGVRDTVQSTYDKVFTVYGDIGALSYQLSRTAFLVANPSNCSLLDDQSSPTYTV